MSRIRLVVNADDLGLASSVNRGIIETIESGIVTSTSLMVNMPARQDALRRLAGLCARGVPVGVGLHFNIVAGRPLAACGSLLDRNGDFLALPVLAWRALIGRIEQSDLQRELDAQLAKARELLEPLGLRVTHIDSHRHAHCLPVAFDLVLETARRHGIPHVRHPFESRALLRRPHARIASHLLRFVLSSRQPMDDVEFTGIGAMASRTFDRDVLEVLSALPPGTTELMVHPGYDSPELGALDAYRQPREREVRALTSPALRQRVRELDVDLTRFGATTPTASPPTPAAPERS